MGSACRRICQPYMEDDPRSWSLEEQGSASAECRDATVWTQVLAASVPGLHQAVRSVSDHTRYYVSQGTHYHPSGLFPQSWLSALYVILSTSTGTAGWRLDTGMSMESTETSWRLDISYAARHVSNLAQKRRREGHRFAMQPRRQSSGRVTRSGIY